MTPPQRNAGGRGEAIINYLKGPVRPPREVAVIPNGRATRSPLRLSNSGRTSCFFLCTLPSFSLSFSLAFLLREGQTGSRLGHPTHTPLPPFTITAASSSCFSRGSSSLASSPDSTVVKVSVFSRFDPSHPPHITWLRLITTHFVGYRASATSSTNRQCVAGVAGVADVDKWPVLRPSNPPIHPHPDSTNDLCQTHTSMHLVSSALCALSLSSPFPLDITI
ncbi:hypothetical protein CDEST_14281 [Colletotrichum destructivum]|uniref:Uncharacterized protein n=1 Tax=Colletotrichum destructivum TaxID=34406 RepID=A0AAX4J1K6_9PEZI|nr:hypothetical protein CDEST_14281 [Colletotrichum destructivum]